MQSLVGAGDRSIAIAELYYLNEKKGRPLDFRTKYARLAQSKQFVLLPFYPSHTLDFDACSAVTEMHDRMIAADVSTYPSRSWLIIGKSFSDLLFSG